MIDPSTARAELNAWIQTTSMKSLMEKLDVWIAEYDSLRCRAEDKNRSLVVEYERDYHMAKEMVSDEEIERYLTRLEDAKDTVAVLEKVNQAHLRQLNRLRDALTVIHLCGPELTEKPKALAYIDP